MRNIVRVNWNKCSVTFKGPRAYDELNAYREYLDSKGIRYCCYRKDFIFWKRLYTINDLSA